MTVQNPPRPTVTPVNKAEGDLVKRKPPEDLSGWMTRFDSALICMGLVEPTRRRGNADLNVLYGGKLTLTSPQGWKIKHDSVLTSLRQATIWSLEKSGHPHVRAVKIADDVPGENSFWYYRSLLTPVALKGLATRFEDELQGFWLWLVRAVVIYLATET
ncbi:MAG: hypothetical protein ACFB0C_19640 [Leptolyngbyaceae cyanobacterium]